MKYRYTCLLTFALICSGCATSKMMLTSAKKEKKTGGVEQAINMARLIERNGDEETASKMYSQIIEKHGDHAVAHHRLGVMAAQKQQVEVALEHFARAEASGSPNADLLSDFGYLHYLNGDLDAAEQKLTAALQVDPDHKAVRNNLGLVYGQRKDWRASFEQFRRATSDAEAFANLAFMQVQAGELRVAKENYLRALDLNQELRSAAEALLQFPEKLPEELPEESRVATSEAPIPNQTANPVYAEPENSQVQQVRYEAEAKSFEPPVIKTVPMTVESQDPLSFSDNQ